MNLFLPTHGGHSDVSLLADKKSPFRQIVPLLSAQEMIVVNFTQLQPRIRPGSALQYVTIHAAQLREGFFAELFVKYQRSRPTTSPSTIIFATMGRLVSFRAIG